MVETGAILVPTRFIVDLLVREGEEHGMPDYAKKKIEMAARVTRQCRDLGQREEASRSPSAPTSGAPGSGAATPRSCRCWSTVA